MSCYYPTHVHDKDGFVRIRPCGSCIGCRLDYSRDWAIRCVHEASMHEENCFITLTYNDCNLPADGSLDKEELNCFIKALRLLVIDFGIFGCSERRVRYYGCGEYGEKLGRPHYHLLLFGFDFPDKEVLSFEEYKKTGISRLYKKKVFDNTIYRSSLLEGIWEKGFSTVGTVNFKSAGYVARYCLKKRNGPQARKHYGGRMSEFSVSSRMPGIGYFWIEKFLNSVYPRDYVSIDGFKFRPPRYYDKYLEKYDFVRYRELVKERRLVAEKKHKDSSVRMHQKEMFKELVCKKLIRKKEA